MFHFNIQFDPLAQMHLLVPFEVEAALLPLRFSSLFRMPPNPLASPSSLASIPTEAGLRLSSRGSSPHPCIMRPLPPTSRDPSKPFLFFRVAQHLSGRPRRKTGLGFFPWPFALLNSSLTT